MSRRRSRSKTITASRLKSFQSFSDSFLLPSGLKSGWKTLSGEWSSALTNVVSATDPSSYPISTIKLSRTDMTASATVSGGTGINFWTVDKDNWWAVVSYNSSSSSSYSCNPYTCCSGQTCGYTNVCQTVFGVISSTGCGCVNIMGCPSGYVSYYGDCGSSQRCGSFPCYITSKIVVGTSCPDPCVGYYSTCSLQYVCSQNCSTCYSTCTSTSYSYVLRLLNSVNGVVNTVGTDIALGSEAVAIEVSTSGNSITAKAYSDTNKTNQLGNTLSYNASSPTKGFNSGIIKTPSNYNQGSTVANFAATVV